MPIAKLSIDIEARLAKFEKDIAGVSRTVEGAVGGIKTAFGALASTVTVGAVVAGLKGIVDELDRIDEAAEQLSLTTDSLSALAYAGRMSGVEFEDMTSALSKLSAKMQDAASGNKEAAAWFKDVGVSVKDSAGNLKSVDQIMAEVADRFSQFENGAAKTALAVDGFGKSGAKLVPLLNQGSVGLKAMREEAEKLGGIIDEKLAKQAAEFNDNLDRLSVLSASAGKAIAGKFLPSLNDTAEAMLKLAKDGDAALAVLRGFGGLGKLPFDALLPDAKHMGLDTSVETQIRDLRGELGRLQDAAKQVEHGGLINRWVYGEKDELARKIEITKNQLAALEKFKGRLEVKPAAGGSSGGSEEIRRTSASSDKPKKTRADDTLGDFMREIEAQAKLAETAIARFRDIQIEASTAGAELTKAERAFLDVISSPEWDAMSAPMQDAVRAQFDLANAAEKAANEAERLSRLLADTESSKIDTARTDMELLTKALETGRISEEKYLEAVASRLGMAKDKTEELASATASVETVITNAFQGMGDALADFALTGKADFGDLVDAMVRDLIRLETQAAMTTIWKQVGGLKGIFGSGGDSASGSGSGILDAVLNRGGVAGSGNTGSGGDFLGGGLRLPSFDVGTDYVPKDMIAMIHKGERITPARFNPAAGGGGGASVVINNYAQAKVEAKETTDSRGGRRVEVTVAELAVAEMNRPGSGAHRSLRSGWGLAPAMVRRG